jgi:hypothetical protein
MLPCAGSSCTAGTAEGYELYTVDHDSGALRLDLRHRWDDASPPQPLTPQEELICDPAAGWLCSKVDCTVDGDDAAAAAIDAPPPVTWLNVGPDSMLAVQDEIIVEYDVRAMAPIGLVCMDLPDDCSVALVDGEGREVDATNTGGCGGAASGRGMRWGGGQGRQRQCLACWIPAQAGDVRGLRGVCAKRGEPWPAWCHAAAHASCALQAPHPRSPSVRRGPRRLPQTAQLPWRWRCGTPTARCTSASGATTPAPSSRSTRCVSVWLGGMQKLGRRVCLDGGHCVRR